MNRWKFLRKTAPVILSVAVASTGLPVTAFAADEFTSEVYEETFEEASGALEDAFTDEDVFSDEETEETEVFLSEAQANVEYALMNIPYADFYKAEVNNDVAVDAFTSATKNKTRTAGLAGGSYHVSAAGEDITGIIYPVKIVGDVDLSGYKQVTDADSVEITVTNRGQTSTQTFTGKDALFENPSYSYYVLNDAPAYYKELTMVNGQLSFGKAVGTVTTLNGADARLITDTTYGDYQLNIEATVPEDITVYGVVVSTKEGNDYGMRHVENIWRVTQLAWGTGFTTEVHGCPVSSAHYAKMMGQTINKVTYYTNAGIFEIPLSDISVPVKFAGTAAVADAKVTDGKTTVEVTGLPADFSPVYSVDGLADAKVENGVLTYSTAAAPGSYTLKVEDANKAYVGLKGTFVLSTADMPAAYDGEAKALKAADGFTTEQLTAYVGKITSVSVNGTDYAASGRGSVVIVNTDGTIKTDAEPITAAGEYAVVVKATGYPELAFTYSVKPAATISLDKTAATIYVKGTPATVTLKATVTNSDEAVTYTSSDTSVATVSAKGVVTAKKAGTATITAASGSATATCKVTVKKPALTLSKKTATIYTKGTTKVTLTAKKAGVKGTVTYSTSNKAIATVSSKGVVTAKKTGTVTITAKCGSYKATCKVTVKAPSLKLGKTSASIAKGKTVTIKATATPAGKVTYKTSNKKIATVTSKGVVKGVAKGKATITVTCNGVSKKFAVTVK
ncbi:MAG: Ig-like domain-containing protein [Eubacteriales bacterium]|nr:Ig-like domain-containing protein [Eubacteriales bacterium]